MEQSIDIILSVISTHSAREDGDSVAAAPAAAYTISTHSAREDGDAVG